MLLVAIPLLLIGGGLAAAYSLPRNVWEAVGIVPQKVDSELPPCCQARGIAAKDAATEFAIASEAAPSIAADEEGRVFVAWSQPADEGSWQIFLATSLDGGVKFDPPRQVVSTSSPPGTSLDIARDKLCLEYWDAAQKHGSTQRMRAESTNGGLTFDDASQTENPTSKLEDIDWDTYCRGYGIGPERKDFGWVAKYLEYVQRFADRNDIEFGAAARQLRPFHLLDTKGDLHLAWSEEIPPADKAPSIGRMIMYAKASTGAEFSEPKAAQPRKMATQKFPVIAVSKDDAVVAFCEINADKAKIVVARVK